MQLLGADTETEYLIVGLDEPGTVEGSFRARQFTVAIQVDSFDNNDGELGVSGSFLGISDPVEGTFETTGKTFTAGFSPKVVV